MCAMMPDTQDDEQNTELADKHDGAEVSRQEISGTFEYIVVLSKDEIESLPEQMDADEFAENLARSRAEKEIDPTFSFGSGDVMAKEQDYPLTEEETRYTVWVRFDQND